MPRFTITIGAPQIIFSLGVFSSKKMIQNESSLSYHSGRKSTMPYRAFKQFALTMLMFLHYWLVENQRVEYLTNKSRNAIVLPSSF